MLNYCLYINRENEIDPSFQLLYHLCLNLGIYSIVFLVVWNTINLVFFNI